jgi:hypothetical protein
MSNQKLKNDLTRSAWTLSTTIKDVVARNLLKAISNKEIVVPKEHQTKLIYLVQASVDSAFESSVKQFQKDIDKASETSEAAKKK